MARHTHHPIFISSTIVAYATAMHRPHLIPKTAALVFLAAALYLSLHIVHIPFPTIFHLSEFEAYDFNATVDEQQCFNNPFPASEPIPKIVHMVWAKNPELNLLTYLAIRSALDSIKPDQLKLHHAGLNDDNPWLRKLQNRITMVPHDLHDEYPKQIQDNWRTPHIADAMRLDILHREGGIYLDMDVISLAPFDHILSTPKQVVLGHEGGDRQGLCNAVILSRPGSPFIRRWIDTYLNFTRSEWNYHSVVLSKKLSLQHRDEVCELPPSVFFWPTWTNRHVRYMHEPITDQQALDFASEIAANGGAMYPDQLAYHAWSHPATKYFQKLTPQLLKEQNTRFNVLVRRFVD
ncbi:nucleotide-diphospho-sugar transferase [Penicillium alfredii]|uniref:Nucleotide-diphospho-sugar transferase n=1 Tax=Penicillium alfredii TaxID=1506179 RepID=A0A9W9JX02_9EURO|nr:nucleotide-diphospho-sugar transferase [Penicillium alfredii]KAJ5084152.1 nucleotide-diphospho-sugar transferase [Penicillium alfredii]